jgi:hypothetical protein
LQDLAKQVKTHNAHPKARPEAHPEQLIAAAKTQLQELRKSDLSPFVSHFRLTFCCQPFSAYEIQSIKNHF